MGWITAVDEAAADGEVAELFAELRWGSGSSTARSK
jgi:hypothetical protein